MQHSDTLLPVYRTHDVVSFYTAKMHYYGREQEAGSLRSSGLGVTLRKERCCPFQPQNGGSVEKGGNRSVESS